MHATYSGGAMRRLLGRASPTQAVKSRRVCLSQTQPVQRSVSGGSAASTAPPPKPQRPAPRLGGPSIILPSPNVVDIREDEVLFRRSLCSSRELVQISEERLQEFLQAEVVYFASLEPKSITLSQILDAKTPQRAANLAYTELPIRFAQRIQQIEGLPGWKESPDLVAVHRLYSDNFRDLRLIELDVAELEPFTAVIQRIKGRMREVVHRLAVAMRTLQRMKGIPEASIVQWLDTFFLSRIGTEMLTSQYLACAADAPRKRGKVGVVDYNCDPARICEQAARHARKLCKDHFPADDADLEISVEHSLASTFELEGQIRFPYVPNYLFYIMVELLKNSARATVEACQDEPDRKRSIMITVGADDGQVAIRVEDQAGGIPFMAADRVWSYMYSTATQGGFSQKGTPLAGYGVGLPLSRLYARYLGGSLHLQSMPGVGTCAYLYLKRLESEAREELPMSSSVSGIPLI